MTSPQWETQEAKSARLAAAFNAAVAMMLTGFDEHNDEHQAIALELVEAVASRESPEMATIAHPVDANGSPVEVST